MLTEIAAPAADAGERDLVARATARDETAIRTIIQRYNRRLYRLARSVLKDDADAEDAVQQAYVKAFAGIGSFRGDAALATWLSRIVINVALDTARRRKASAAFTAASHTNGENIGLAVAPTLDPERSLAQREIRLLVEQAIDRLPEVFRTVLVARVVEGMSVEETADLLGIRAETVKTRLHRARRLVQEALEQQLGPALTGVFPFLGRRCELMADRVMAQLRQVR
jgi:RNA polymerase sigma-70 factor, ECF subfamily